MFIQYSYFWEINEKVDIKYFHFLLTSYSTLYEYIILAFLSCNMFQWIRNWKFFYQILVKLSLNNMYVRVFSNRGEERYYFRPLCTPLKISTTTNIFINKSYRKSVKCFNFSLQPEAEFKEFERRLKFKQRFQIKLYSLFQDLSRRSIETGFWRI